VIAGLLLLAAGILIPGHRELLDLRGELLRQETREQMAFEQLRAYDEFLAGVRESDPEVIRRLAMAHLNKIPAGEESLLLTPGMNQTVGEWVESSIPDRTVVVPPYPDTVLARWANGPGRLWLLGAAVTLLFAGFVLGPSTAAIPALGGMVARRRPVIEPIAAAAVEEPLAAEEVSAETVEVAEDSEVEPVAADAEEPSIPSRSPDFDLVETKAIGLSAEGDPGDAVADDLRAEELELWRASETGGEGAWSEWTDRLPPAESADSCDDVTLAFFDASDGDLQGPTDRASD
jgi:hypothetical protein